MRNLAAEITRVFSTRAFGGEGPAVFVGDGNRAACVEIHCNVNLRGARAQYLIARATGAVFKGGGTIAHPGDEDFHVNFIAIEEGDEELCLCVDGGKTDAFVGYQLLITDTATGGEEFFERDVKVMKDVRIIDQSRRVCVAEPHCDACGERHDEAVTSDE